MKTPAAVAVIHTATISQRNRTSNLAIVVNILVLPYGHQLESGQCRFPTDRSRHMMKVLLPRAASLVSLLILLRSSRRGLSARDTLGRRRVELVDDPLDHRVVRAVPVFQPPVL